MPTRYWIGVIAGDHVATTQNDGICAFSFGKETSMAKLAVGDRYAYCAPSAGIGDGEMRQSFVALGTVTGAQPV